MRRSPYTPGPPVPPREVVNSVVYVPCKVDSRQYIDVNGWDPVTRAMMVFKLNATTVSDTTVI